MINKEDLMELMKVRHSGYSYNQNRVVHQEDINMLIEAARLSPSCYGDEPWRYVICNRQSNQNAWEKLLSCLTEPNQRWAKSTQVLIIALSAKNYRDHTRGANLWGGYDTGAASYALMLQATSMNLMAHQMGGFDGDKIVEKFNIPDDFDVRSVIAIGYEEEGAEVKEKTRRPIEGMFFYGEWPKS